MEIKIDMNGSDIELATFLHGLTINHSQKEQSAVKTANTKKKGRPKKVVKAEPAPSDDILDDPEMANTITVGRVEEFVPDVRVYTSFLVEDLQNQAYDDAGEYAETWLADVTDDDFDDLENILDAAFTRWLDRHPEYKPNFYTLTDTETFNKGGDPIE